MIRRMLAKAPKDRFQTAEELVRALERPTVKRSATASVTPRPRVAAPCVEFTSFMLGLEEVAPLAEIEAPLADLHDGRRGFIVAADHARSAVEISVGDKVYFGV